MTRQLPMTFRSDLRAGSGANTHFCFNPSVYAVGRTPNKAIVDQLIDLGVGYIRERWWPANPAQQAAFATLADAGIRFYLFVGDMTYGPADVQADVALLAKSPVYKSVAAVCGPNEPNAHGGSAWPARVTMIQQSIYNAVHGSKSFASSISVVGPALKHNVANVDADYQAVAAAGIQRWCDAGDFHFYPGNAGPIQNAAEAQRATQAYGPLPLWHSETGWTGADTDPEMAGRFSVEALLRNHVNGVIGTFIYEFADESQYVSGREGLFGLVTAAAPKAGYTAVSTLLATPDGGEAFPGQLGTYSKTVESDADVVVTSDGGGRWTLYLLQNTQGRVPVLLPPGSLCDAGTCTVASDGTKRYLVTFDTTMKVVHVTPELQMRNRRPGDSGNSRP